MYIYSLLSFRIENERLQDELDALIIERDEVCHHPSPQ